LVNRKIPANAIGPGLNILQAETAATISKTVMARIMPRTRMALYAFR
jgi:hypothetical protein